MESLKKGDFGFDKLLAVLECPAGPIQRMGLWLEASEFRKPKKDEYVGGSLGSIWKTNHDYVQECLVIYSVCEKPGKPTPKEVPESEFAYFKHKDYMMRIEKCRITKQGSKYVQIDDGLRLIGWEPIEVPVKEPEFRYWRVRDYNSGTSHVKMRGKVCVEEISSTVDKIGLAYWNDYNFAGNPWFEEVTAEVYELAKVPVVKKIEPLHSAYIIFEGYQPTSNMEVKLRDYVIVLANKIAELIKDVNELKAKVK